MNPLHCTKWGRSASLLRSFSLAVGLQFCVSVAGAASIVTYDYDAFVTPSGLNSGETPPVSSTATGSFSYDGDQILTEADGGFFTLTAFSFMPAANTEAGNFVCEPITNCVQDLLPKFNPATTSLLVALTLDSYFVSYATGAPDIGIYSDNNSFGAWQITNFSRRTGDNNDVPEPGTLALLGLGLGLAGLAASRRRRQ